MSKELELWSFIAVRLRRGERVMLLVVANSRGSSPGHAGYKMAVATDGELSGSIGGGVMEVNLVEQARAVLSEPDTVMSGFSDTSISRQTHRKDSPNPSGMICSGEQTVIFKLLSNKVANDVDAIVSCLQDRRRDVLKITPSSFEVKQAEEENLNSDIIFEKLSDTDFVYGERIGAKNDLFIIGGGHCALALSELMSKMDFHISIFDDRQELNTIEKNDFADRVTVIDTYQKVREHISKGDNVYVVVMTLGYQSDTVVVRQLIDHDLKYFGVLGSRAKMITLMKELKNQGLDPDKLARIKTPIGLSINSRTPEEIAVSIAAEIISIKNA